MKQLTIIAIAVLFSITQLMAGETTWKFDKSHSSVQFEATHMVISTVTGNFKIFEGTVVTNGDNMSGAKIDFTVDVGSINTDNKKRDNHLKGDDFFNAKKYPKMEFKSTSLKKVSGKNYKLTGYLTIRDVKKKVVLDVKYNGQAKDPMGNIRAGFKITGEIDRFEYGLKWNKIMEAGGLMVGKDIGININVEIMRKAGKK